MSGLARKLAILLFGGLLFMGCASTEIKVDNTCGDITIAGTLENVKGAPAETTGWALLLDKGLTVNGKSFSFVEVFTNKDLKPFMGKHVEAVGCITNAKGIGEGQNAAFVPKTIVAKKRYLIF